MHIGIKGLIQSGGKRVGNATIKVINMPSGSPIKHDVLSGKDYYSKLPFIEGVHVLLCKDSLKFI